jgi:hypothetical protein
MPTIYHALPKIQIHEHESVISNCFYLYEIINDTILQFGMKVFILFCTCNGITTYV